MANHMLVFNLGLADSLMGIYLLILGAMGFVYSGVYCANKVEWLSSGTCSALGVLVVASSETSVITMVLLTSLRLHAVFRVSKRLLKFYPMVSHFWQLLFSAASCR